MKKEQMSDPTHVGGNLVTEIQTVTVSGGNVTVTFNESYDSQPVVLPIAKYSANTNVTIDSNSTFDTTECTLLGENDCDVDVLVIRVD